MAAMLMGAMWIKLPYMYVHIGIHKTYTLILLSFWKFLRTYWQADWQTNEQSER